MSRKRLQGLWLLNPLMVFVRLDTLILPFYGVVAMFEPMLPACYRYAVNQLDACVIEVFVEGMLVAA